MLDWTIILQGAAMVGSFVAGYYTAHRGWTGVMSDLNDIKMDLVHIKAKFETPTVVTPNVVQG